MGCDISGEQLWSWVDRDAPELEEHLAICPACRERAAKIREEIGVLAGDATEEIPIPDKIGPYTIRRLIGEGGQALVYEAEQLSPRRPVALKLLKGGQMADKTRLRHFRREIQSLARLNHPGIATIYEAGRTPDGLRYFAMELVGGMPLHVFVKEKKPSREERLRIFQKVCSAVHYAHEQGVIHRDLKPSNIMINPDGEPKILDFGLARLLGDEGASLTMTKEGHVEGTPRYMSPEQIMGAQNQIDNRTDVYALGVILYELMTGTPPKAITTISPATIKRLCEEIPPMPSSIDSSLRGDLDAIVMKALEKKREDRYASPKDLADDISRYLAGEPIVARRPNVFYSLRKKTFSRASHVWIGVVVIAIAAGLAYMSWHGKRPPSDPLADRMTLLDTRCRLLGNNPTDVVFHQAVEAPSRYSGIPEAVLVSAQANHLRRDYSQAAAELARAQKDDPLQWVYGYLLEEIQSARRPMAGHAHANSHWDPKLALSADAWYLRSFATLDIDSALAWAREAVALQPQHVPARAAIARLSEIKGDTESALAATERLARGEYQPDVWIRYRAELLARLGRFEDALTECDRLIAGWPETPLGYHLRAKLERRIKRFADAERDFSAVIDMMTGRRYETGWLFYHRATIRWLMGRREEAASDYKDAYDHLAYPTFANARLYILLRELGRTAEAEAVLADSRRTNIDDPWLGRIFDCLDGSLAPDRLAAIAESTGRPVAMCEGYYYAAEAARLGGHMSDAYQWFTRCVGTGVECDPKNILESQSEFQLAEMRLSQVSAAASTNPNQEQSHR
jgi:serine/threonine protein kinase/tetratricopeptide (TPR) repeat protein